MSESDTAERQTSQPAGTVAAILAALSGLRFGQLTIKVQDGRVVQIERTEKQRLNDPPRR
ncbi:MAG: YezD family protein [Planctomyces sp.]|nr:YezD family protein [Planctomyces sp.]